MQTIKIIKEIFYVYSLSSLYQLNSYIPMQQKIQLKHSAFNVCSSTSGNIVILNAVM